MFLEVGKLPLAGFFWINSSRFRGASWNIFSDPIAANSVFSFGVPLVIGSSEFEDENPFSTRLG